MRAEAKEYVSENLQTERIPFTFPLKDGHNTIEIHKVPMSYIRDLWKNIQEMLAMNDDTTKEREACAIERGLRYCKHYISACLIYHRIHRLT